MIGAEVDGKVRRARNLEEARRMVDASLQREQVRERRRMLAGFGIVAAAVAAVCVVMSALIGGMT